MAQLIIARSMHLLVSMICGYLLWPMAINYAANNVHLILHLKLFSRSSNHISHAAALATVAGTQFDEKRLYIKKHPVMLRWVRTKTKVRTGTALVAVMLQKFLRRFIA